MSTKSITDENINKIYQDKSQKSAKDNFNKRE